MMLMKRWAPIVGIINNSIGSPIEKRLRRTGNPLMSVTEPTSGFRFYLPFFKYGNFLTFVCFLI